MSKAQIIFGVSVAVLLGVAISLFLYDPEGESEAAEGLTFYCAAGLKAPVAEIAKEYEKEYDTKINIIYGGSGTLLGNVEVAKKGDLYLAGDSSYIQTAHEKELVDESIPVAQLRAGLAVKKGNPHAIKSLQDVIDNPKLKIGLGNPDAAYIGKLSKEVLTKHNLWDVFQKRTKDDGVFTGTVNELANNVKLDAVDVVIVWDAIASQYPEVDFVEVPEFAPYPNNATIGILRSTKTPTAALHFARYLSAKDKGLLNFKKYGYNVAKGDKWASKPEIKLFSGSMLRPAIKKSLKEFEEREGVSISTIFNGCGVLVSQMKAGAKPDCYLSCDTKFMEQVQDRFDPSKDITCNDIMLVVAKGNPKNIKTLEDLTKPGIELGLAHPEKSALGWLTVRMLEAAGLDKKLKLSKNVTVDTPNADFLVNMISVGSLDAVIIYRSNYLASQTAVRDCEMISIDRKEALATQPYAVAKDNEFKQLHARLIEHITRDPKRFTDIGFYWRWDQPTSKKSAEQPAPPAAEPTATPEGTE